MSLKQRSMQCYAHIPERHYRPGGALPFRSRDAADLNKIQHVKWQTSNYEYGSKQHDSHSAADYLSSAEELKKESSKSRLDSSPTSVIEQAHGENNPPTPSPICSPCPSPAVSSPRHPFLSKRLELPSELSPSSLLGRGDGASSSKRHEIEGVAPPDSPRGSFSSSTTEGGLLALLASKLFSYRERHSPQIRDASDSIDDKHMTEGDRGSKPSVEEVLVHVTASESVATDHQHRRSPSETLSEISLGSANERSMSMEFDAMLAAAVAAGIGRANAMRYVEDAQGIDLAERPAERLQLAGIQEDHSLSGIDESRLRPSNGEDDGPNLDRNDSGASDLILVESTAPAAALVGSIVPRQGANIEDRSLSSIRRTEPDTQIVPTTRLSSRSSSHGSSIEQENQIVPYVPLSSRGSSRGKEDSLAIVLRDERAAEAPSSSRSSSSSSSKENVAPSPAQMALQRVRKDKIYATALAYQEAKNSKCANRYKREETKILAWENQQKIKAAMSMKKVEMKLEQKRAKAFEKMQNEIARAHKKAEERKATAEAIRGEKAAKAEERAGRIRQTGEMPNRCLFF